MSTVNETQLAVFHGFDYSEYGNGTISNFTRCYLTRQGFKAPIILNNGTVVNGTSCDTPDDPVGVHGVIGVLFACLAGVFLPLCVYNLRKHGKSLFPRSKLMPHANRWEYYWCLIMAAVGLISGLFYLDVDRDVAQGTSMAIYGITFEALNSILLCCVWELTRNWNKQSRDRFKDDHADFTTHEERTRLTYKLEFALPIIFYVLAFVSFFLESLRPWTRVMRSIPAAAMDSRFKAGAGLSIVAFLIILAQFVTTILSWSPERRSITVTCIIFCFVMAIIRIVYQNLQFYQYSANSLNTDASLGYVVVLGWIPVILTLAAINTKGLLCMNEDQYLLEKRNKRDKDYREALHRGDFQGLIETRRAPPYEPTKIDKITESTRSVSTNSGLASVQNPPPPQYELTDLGFIRPRRDYA